MAGEGDSVPRSVGNPDRHINVAQNLALTRNALLAMIPFDEKRNLPSLIAEYQEPSNSPSIFLRSDKSLGSWP